MKYMIHNKTIIKAAILLPLLFPILFSCHNAKEPDNQQLFRQAETLIVQHPDSTLTLLAGIENPGGLPNAQRADYYFLFAQATFKSGGSFYKDSIAAQLTDAIDYFVKAKNNGKTAWAYFLRNRTYFDPDSETGDIEKAMQDCLKAKEYAEKAGDDELLQLAHQEIGNIYYTQYLFDDALASFKKSKQYSKKAAPVKDEIIRCGKLGSAYNQLGQYDSALVYQNRALELALAANDTSAQTRVVIASLYKNIGFSHKKKGDHRAEKDALLAAYLISPQREGRSMNVILYSLSQAYTQLNQTDSSMYYALKYATVENENIQEEAFRANHFYKLYKSAGNKDLALENLELLVLTCDKIYKENLSRSVLEIQKKYDKEALENQYNKVLVQRLYLVIIVFVTLLLGILSAWYFRNRIRRKETDLAEAQQALHAFRGTIMQQDSQLQYYDGEISKRDEQLHVYNELLMGQTEQLEDYDRLLSERNEKDKHLHSILMDRLDIAHRVAQMNVVSTENTRIFMAQFHKVFGKNLLDWELIRPTINELYGGFVDKLAAAHPDLGDKDLQLCCFVRAGFRTEELAVLLGMTQSSVRVKRTRLVKRMGFDSAESFLSYLEKL